MRGTRGAYAELVQFWDDKSLSSIMREVADNERKAPNILCRHYAGKGKPRVISLYTQLTPLKKDCIESVKDYVIRTNYFNNPEKCRTNCWQCNDIAMILPRHFNPFFIHVTHSNKELTFIEFKTKLHSYVKTLKHRDLSCSDDVMKLIPSFSKAMKNESRDRRDVSCFTCGGKGHLTYQMKKKLWCSNCKGTTHKRKSCRYKRRDTV